MQVCGFVSCDVKVGSRVERKAQTREQIDRASGVYITAGTSATFHPKLVGKSCGFSRLRYNRANGEIDNVGSTNWAWCLGNVKLVVCFGSPRELLLP